MDGKKYECRVCHGRKEEGERRKEEGGGFGRLGWEDGDGE